MPTTEQGTVLAIADTGIGMSEEMTRQTFMSIFGTRNVEQGNELGRTVARGAPHDGGNVDGV